MPQDPKQHQDLISIITPVYNTGECLRQCLQSCLDQTYTNLEIIAVDDCSTDAYTREILQEFADKDPRIKVIWCPENHGQGYCRNVGVDNCHGKYFSFIDSDDYFKPEFIEKMYEGMEKFKTDFAICDTYNYVDDPTMYDIKLFVVDDSETRFNFNSPHESVINNHDLASVGYLISFPASCYGKMFNTKAYRDADIRFYDGEFSHHCQDEDWATTTIVKLKNFVVLKFIGLMRRMRRGTASMPSKEYFQCSIDAALRRFKVIEPQPYAYFYKNSIALNLIKRATRLTYVNENYFDRLKVIELTHDYLIKFDSICNTSPYYYSCPISCAWHPLLGALDANPLPLLYFSLRPLHNSFNGETYYTKQLLEGLAAQGIFTSSFNTLHHTSNVPLQIYKKIEKEALKFKTQDDDIDPPHINPTSPLFEFKDNGVSYLVAKTRPFTRPEFYSEVDIEILRQGVTKTAQTYFKNKGTGLIMVSGGDLVAQCVAYILSKFGYKILYLVSHPDDLHFSDKRTPDKQQLLQLLESAIKTSFAEYNQEAEAAGKTERLTYEPDADSPYLFKPQDFAAVFATIPYYAERFKQQHGVDVEYYGSPLNPWVEVVQPDKPHASILYPNPTLENGLAVVLKLVQRFHELHPDKEFTVLQNMDGSLQEALTKLHDAKGNNISILKDSLSHLHMVMDQIIDPVSLMGLSRVCLKPMLSENETIGCILEAACNDVPVVGSDNAKLKSVLGEHGIYLQIPESTKKDPTCIPSDEEIQPWVEALENVLSTPWQNRTSLDTLKEDYRRTMRQWVERLFELAEVPEVHEHTEERSIY